MAIKTTVTVTVKTGKQTQRFLNRLKQFEEREITAGIFGTSAKKTVLTNKFGRKPKRSRRLRVGTLATMQEEGYHYEVKKDIRFKHPHIADKWVYIPKGKIITVPKRPAFKRVCSNKYSYKRTLNSVADREINNVLTKKGTVTKAMRKIGETLRNLIIKSYTSGDYTANSSLTKSLKQHGVPLIGTEGQIIKNIKFKVNKSGKVDSRLSSLLKQVNSSKLRKK